MFLTTLINIQPAEKAIIRISGNIPNTEKIFSPLLDLLFNNKQAKQGDILPSYTEFESLIDKQKYNDNDLKRFLTICNYLDLTKLSDDKRIALVDYEKASSVLGNYLSFK